MNPGQKFVPTPLVPTGHKGHNRIVFSLISCNEGHVILSTSMDRNLIVWKLDTSAHHVDIVGSESTAGSWRNQLLTDGESNSSNELLFT